MEAVVRGRRVQPLAQLLADEFRDRRDKGELATLVGDRSFEEMERWIEELTLEHVGTRCDGGLFAMKRAGAVFGVVLESGEPAVLKLFPPSYDEPQLAAIHRCVATAAAHG